MPFRRAAATLVPLICLVASTCFAPSEASAQDYLARVNDSFSLIRPELRSDTKLLPLLAKMEPAPVGADRFDQSRLLPAGSQVWSAASAWAQAPSQQEILKALAEVTAEEDYRFAFGFGQPYGTQGVPVAQIRAKLYTELGDPPLLAGARHLYMPAFETMGCLVNVEATRLVEDGKPSDAIDLLVNWLFFARQIADREFFAEMEWALSTMASTFERIRDVAYQDSQGARAIDPDRLLEVIDRLDGSGFIGIDRLTLPRADMIGVEQTIARVYVNQGAVNKATFGSTLARLRSADRPLRLYGEAAKWDSIADRQKNWFDINEDVRKIINDWTSRWTLEWFDQRMTQAYEYRGLDASSSVIQATAPDMGRLFDLRQIVRAEDVGTRHALGVYGYYLTMGAWPPTLAAIRPTWIGQLEADPFNPRRERGARPPMEFFVPIRDTRLQFGDRETPQPHDMNIVTPNANFSRRIGEDQFVLYSVGGNGGKDWARQIQNTAENAAGADYLIWPPIVSLQRQHLIERGQLK